MVALGLLLLLLSGLLTGAMVLQNTDASSASVFGQAITGTVGGLFLAGAIAGAVAILGVMLMLAGAARRRTRRLALKRQARDARGEKESLAEENARLRDELGASRTHAEVYPQQVTSVSEPVDGQSGRGRHGLFNR